MRAPYCGSTDSKHVIRNCDECQTIRLRELNDGRNDRICPSCKARHRVPPDNVSTHFGLLNLSKEQWRQLRRAAESFDTAASNSDEYDLGGSGDGETLFPARTFIDWIKPDCEGFRGKGQSVIPQVDGGGDRNRRHPFELPQASDGTRTTRRPAA